MDTGESQLQTLLGAIRDGDAKRFRGTLTSDFARDLSDGDVASLAQEVGAHLAGGCTTTYLGSLKQDGSLVYLWQVGFSDGSDDALVRLVLDDTQIAGFIITPPFA